MSKKIYIAGPMSGYDNFNYPAFHKAADELRELGCSVESPAEYEGRPLMPPTKEDAKPHSYYMREALEKLMQCDAILMLKGWKKSEGACLELSIAQALDMAIYYQERQ